MLMILFVFISIIGYASCSNQMPIDVTSFKKVLDDMENHYEPGKTYNDKYFKNLIECMNTDDDVLVRS